MSQIHRVIILNKPFQFGFAGYRFTIIQWLLLAAGLAASFYFASQAPKEWKVANGIPGGVVVFIAMMGVSMVLVTMSQVKPLIWWKNSIGYRLGLMPRIFMSKPEAAPTYPSGNIMELKRDKIGNQPS